MSIFDFFRRPVRSGPWVPYDDTDTDGAPKGIRRPVNIIQTKLPQPHHLASGDQMTVKFSSRDEKGRLLESATPKFDIEHSMTVNAITKFEVIDEFGYDVGIGFVLGQTR